MPFGQCEPLDRDRTLGRGIDLRGQSGYRLLKDRGLQCRWRWAHTAVAHVGERAAHLGNDVRRRHLLKLADHYAGLAKRIANKLARRCLTAARNSIGLQENRIIPSALVEAVGDRYQCLLLNVHLDDVSERRSAASVSNLRSAMASSTGVTVFFGGVEPHGALSVEAKDRLGPSVGWAR